MGALQCLHALTFESRDAPRMSGSWHHLEALPCLREVIFYSSSSHFTAPLPPDLQRLAEQGVHIQRH